METKYCPVCRLVVAEHDPERNVSCGIVYHRSCWKRMMTRIDKLLMKVKYATQ